MGRNGGPGPGPWAGTGRCRCRRDVALNSAADAVICVLSTKGRKGDYPLLEADGFETGDTEGVSGYGDQADVEPSSKSSSKIRSGSPIS